MVERISGIRRIPVGPLFIILVLLATVAPPTLAAECTTDLSSRLERRVVERTSTLYSFRVDLRTRDRCAVVDFDFIVDVRQPDGEITQETLPQRVRMRDGSIARLVTYRVSSDRRLARWNFEVQGCQECPTP